MNFYKEAGVDVELGDKASREIFQQLSRTFNNSTEVYGDLISLNLDLPRFKEPRPGFAVDGVGTKLEYAFAASQHTTIGIDLVAMCVNDLVRKNIIPKVFCCYRAMGKLDLGILEKVSQGIIHGCIESDCVYATGETAEMPGFYQNKEYELAGFAFGIFEKDQLITGEKIKAGDSIIGLYSSGFHSNGFSTIRKVFPPDPKEVFLNAELLEPTRIYVKLLNYLNQTYPVHGWAHITGGGIVGKLGKIIPEGLTAVLDWKSWRKILLFYDLKEKGNISTEEMFRTFNMGLGMIGVIPKELTKDFLHTTAAFGEEAYLIGTVVDSFSESRVNILNCDL